MRIVRYPVVVVKNVDEVLLGFHKKGFNKNKWTLIGGGLQRKEVLQDAAVRNLKLQCGLTTDNLEKAGKVEIKFAGVLELLQIHVFVADSFSGELTSSPDLELQWFKPRDIPCNEAWADLPFWLGPVLSGSKVKAFFVYENEDIVYKEVTKY